MTIYRKRPIEVEAIQFTGDNVAEIWDKFGATGIYAGYENSPDHLILTTTHGDPAPARAGDWIVPDSTPGTFYPIKPDVFEATYEPAFWAVHVQGPDDIVAAADRTDADRLASEINEFMAQMMGRSDASPHAPKILAVVVPWKWTAEAHAEALTRQAEAGEYTP